eukprot:223668-Pleurochrysis_carterae.AAC.1
MLVSRAEGRGDVVLGVDDDDDDEEEEDSISLTRSARRNASRLTTSPASAAAVMRDYMYFFAMLQACMQRPCRRVGTQASDSM